MKSVTRLIHASLLIAGAFSTSVAIACTTSLWNGGVDGTPVTGSPGDVSRVSGLCAMELTAAGSVKDTSPSAEPAAFVRFYVKGQLSAGAPVIFEAFTAGDASLLTVTFDGSNFVFYAGDDTSAAVPGNAGWNLVELSWTGGGVMEYWVNTDATQVASLGSVTAIAGTMDSVILGNRVDDVYTGTLTFDDYESRRSTPVGPSDVCNADSLGEINLLDALEIVDEFFAAPDSPDLAIGSPDCDLSGTVNLLDALEVVDIFFGT